MTKKKQKQKKKNQGIPKIICKLILAGTCMCVPNIMAIYQSFFYFFYYYYLNK